MDGNVQMNFDPMTGEPLKPAAEPAAAEPVAAEPAAAEPVVAEPAAAEPVTQPVTQPAPQPVYTEPAPQPVYAQPVYTQPAAQPVYVQPVYVQQPAPQPAATNEVVYPGKEIVGLVFGIFSVINGICGLAIVIPIYGWIFGGICAVSGIIYALLLPPGTPGLCGQRTTDGTGKPRHSEVDQGSWFNPAPVARCWIYGLVQEQMGS